MTTLSACWHVLVFPKDKVGANTEFKKRLSADFLIEVVFVPLSDGVAEFIPLLLTLCWGEVFCEY